MYVNNNSQKLHILNDVFCAYYKVSGKGELGRDGNFTDRLRYCLEADIPGLLIYANQISKKEWQTNNSNNSYYYLNLVRVPRKTGHGFQSGR